MGTTSGLKPLPGLLMGIGAMKAGTSWLYEMLRCHPALSCAPVKEIHYFWECYGTFSLLSPEQRRATAASHISGQLPTLATAEIGPYLDWYKAYLADPVDDHWFTSLFPPRRGTAFCVEFSNMSAHLGPAGWAHVRRFTDRLRILYALRSPVRRLWSHARFHAAIIGRLDQLPHFDAAAFKAFLTESGCFQNGRYAEVLSRLAAECDTSEYLVVHAEEMAAEPLQVMRGIEAFLRVAPAAYPAELAAARLNVSPSLTMPPAFAAAAASEIWRELDALGAAGFPVPPDWIADAEALAARPG
ncbi:hypothetical protein Acid7E03_32860 [Acidisoma sp. 7E03]